MMLSLPYDALVAGGGPAGSMVAALLARTGRSVVVVERSRYAQHKVCGEFISPESLPLLRQIEVDPETLGAQTIRRLRVVARSVLAEADLPEPALSLTRRTLDEVLLMRARLAGARVLRGYNVDQLCRIERGWRAGITDGTGICFKLCGQDAFLATGKHELRGWARETRGSQDDLVAFKMYFTLTRSSTADLADHIELIFFPGGYAGLQPVERGEVNLCALVTRRKLRQLGGRWNALVAHMTRHVPLLARRLAGASPSLDRPLALFHIPYGYCALAKQEDSEPWRLGDQAAVMPSFAGDGMSIALHTAKRAAELYLSGATAAALHGEIRRRFRSRLTAATVLSRMLIALPSIARVAQLRPSLLEEIFIATRLPIMVAGEDGSSVSVRS